ncbi:MAG: FHA domain-containing protein [Coriobacteriales bacterium]
MTEHEERGLQAAKQVAAEPELATEPLVVGALRCESSCETLEFELPATFGIGKAASFKLEGNPVVQRLHFSIFSASGREMIKDLTCVPNAVFVNGRGLPSRGSRFIKPGAVISIGSENYVYAGLLGPEETRLYAERKASASNAGEESE